MKFFLPYPPSINNYYGRAKNGRVYIKQAGVAFRRRLKVCVLLHGFKHTYTTPIKIDMIVYPPDNRRRDLDNIEKALFDALTKAEVWADDSLIRERRSRWGDVKQFGTIELEIKHM